MKLRKSIDMRGSCLILGITAILGSCSQAFAAAPDSKNPAHCIAAYNYAAYWFKVGKRPDKVAEQLARVLYALQKVKANGGSQPDVVAEGKRFSRDHVKNDAEMDALYLACNRELANDPRFRAEFAALIEDARSLVPKFEEATRR